MLTVELTGDLGELLAAVIRAEYWCSKRDYVRCAHELRCLIDDLLQSRDILPGDFQALDEIDHVRGVL